MAASENPVFGKRRQQHIIILASGDKIRHMTVRPWMAALGICLVGTMAIGYLAATSYLVFRDNLIGATMARQARMQHEYEDRIAALRAQVDRVTSRQLLDQQVVEDKVEKLLEQQVALTSRHGRLGELLDRAEQSGVVPATPEGAEPSQGAGLGSEIPPVPTLKPAGSAERASLSGGITAIDKLMGKAVASTPSPRNAFTLAYAPLRETAADRADRVFSTVTRSLKTIERDQLDRIQKLTIGASSAAEEISTILAKTGVELSTATPAPEADIGGPYLAPQAPAVFETSLSDLDSALNRLEWARDTAKRLPFASPAPGQDITSRYGNRMDPFLGKLALHAGIDFRSPVGGQIHSPGAGTVTAAGFSGGYGNMVEIDHGDGYSTRYGHMSKIMVKTGDSVEIGDLLGLSGNTGRSTGPHLHYEVRRNGRAVDPMRFINAGMRLEGLLN